MFCPDDLAGDCPFLANLQVAQTRRRARATTRCIRCSQRRGNSVAPRCAACDPDRQHRKIGMVANQNSACRLSQQFTVDQVTAAFGLED